MSFKRRAELSRTVSAGPSRAAPWAQGTNVWQFLYSAGLLQTPAILVYIEYVIAVYKCLAIRVFSKIVYKCQQCFYTLSMQSRYTNAWHFLYWGRLFKNASKSCIHRLCNCGIEMLGNSGIQPDCSQMPAIPEYIEYSIAVYRCLVIPVISPAVFKRKQVRYTLNMRLRYTIFW